MDISKKTPDQNAQEEGVWIPYDDETKFKVRSTESKAYTRAVQKHTRKLSPAQKNSIGIMKGITTSCLCEAILIDWEGVENDGKPLKCNDENKKLLMQVPEVRDFIADSAQEHANFERESVKADAESVKKP